MHTKHAHSSINTRHLFRKLTALALPCILLGMPSVESGQLQRPQVAPGGNNWKRPDRPVVCALSTLDLNSGLTPANLVTALLGPGVTVSNVTFTGANVAAGTFVGGTGIVGFESGIILSSGDISFVPGPNTQDSTTADNALPGDPDLDLLIPGYTTYDACVLEFDFECQGTQVISFQYVFTSEEYNEWVNTAYNDVFGFFLNGVNIALVPGSNGTPVSIDNVNCDNPYNPPAGSFCNLYVNNRCADLPPGTWPCAGVRDTEMDGLTVVLTATGTLQPGSNHIKLAIADAGDHVLDSNVFIHGQSFVCGQPSGACCNTSTHTCQDNVLQSNCQGPYDVWSVGLACSQLSPPCNPVNHPQGTDCENPIPITTIPYTDANTTCGMDNDYTNTCLGSYDNGEDILYVLSVTSPRCVDITVTGATPSDEWIGVAVDNVCPPSATCLAYATTSSTVATISNLTLTPGLYYLMIDSWAGLEDCITFTLSITDCQAPIAGACCFGTYQGACQMLTESDCTTQSGTFRGPGVACDPSGTSVCGCVGDCNCDGAVNFDDINPFVETISTGTSCNLYNADCDGNGLVDFDDINPFVALLSDPAYQCP
jgi:hypothetical protein